MRIGVLLLVMVLAGGIALFQKDRIGATLASGEIVQAEFQRSYRIRPFVTQVKVAGVRVGVVTDVHPSEDGHAEVTMKVDDGTQQKLGSTPAAAIRPVTLLGGNYYVELKPGGDPTVSTGTIPTTRTTTPVELDHVLEMLQPPVRRSTQRTVARLDAVLKRHGQHAIRSLVRDAPHTLRPTATVLTALRGTAPDLDLPRLVTSLESGAWALTRGEGRLGSVVRDSATVTAALHRERTALAKSLEGLPAELHATRTGLKALDGSLAQLRTTADEAAPVARELDPLLDQLQPALIEVRPLLRDLRPALADTRPLLRSLVPTVRRGTHVLGGISGRPLKRINGPVMSTVHSPWHGQGQYADGGSNRPLYKELAYMVAGLDNVARMTDANGATIHFQPGAGIGTASGMPISLEKMLRRLLYPEGSRR